MKVQSLCEALLKIFLCNDLLKLGREIMAKLMATFWEKMRKSEVFLLSKKTKEIHHS